MNLKTNTTTPQLQVAFSKKENTIEVGKHAIVPKIIAHQSIYLAQRREMLEKYRHYVQQYANACPELNKTVIEYNSKVISHIEQTNNKEWAIGATEAFKSDLGKCSTIEYNQAAKARNIELAQPLIKLKKYVPVKKSTEHVFSMLIFKYGMQIDEKNKILLNCGATTTRALQKVKVNHHELANTVIDDVNTLPYCKRTIHNHINRLVEAGILFDYTFRGREKPVEYHVNSLILTLFCNQKRKSLNSENQLFKYQFENNLHNNEIDTRTYKNKKEIIEPVNKQSRIKGTETLSGVLNQMQLSSKNDNHKNNNENTNTRKQPNFERQTTAADFLPKISEYLYQNIEDVQILMQKLTHGHYKNYRFIHRHQLEKEVYHGNLPKTEFRELLLQVFIKLSAPIYKNSTPNEGSWRKAWNIMSDEFLLNPNGSIPNKPVLMYKFDNLVYRITYAKRFFNKFPEFNALYPSQYFDPTRKQKKSGGFAYTIEALKKHQKSIENREKQKQKQVVAAQKRNYKLKAIELVEKQVNKLKNGKITIPQLHDYVSNNAHIPQDVKKNLPKYIQRIYSC